MDTIEAYTQKRLTALRARMEQKRRNRFKKRICAVITLAAVCAASVGTIYTASAKDITITEIDEFAGVLSSTTVRTRASEVKDVLKEQGIELSHTDKLNVSSDAKPEEENEIILRRGKEIRVVTDNSSETVVVTSADTQQALLEAGYVTSAADEITLSGESVALSDTIEIKSVSMWYESEAEEIAYDTVYEDDPDMYIGEEKTVTEGVPGKLIKTYKVTRYADGTEKDRVLDSEVTETEPVSKVIKKGTKAKPTPQPTVTAASVVSGNTIAGHSYSKKLTMTATAYTGGTKTATGTTPRYGEVAVDPSVIPLGSKLYIECSDGSIVYGVAYAEDTGGAIKGNIVDLYYNSRSECIQFGRRSVTVYILND